MINIVAWGTLAETVGNQLRKGARVFVEGRYSTRSYEAADGSRRYVTEVVANLIALPLGTHQEQKEPGNFSQFGIEEPDERPRAKSQKPEYEMGTITF